MQIRTYTIVAAIAGLIAFGGYYNEQKSPATQLSHAAMQSDTKRELHVESRVSEVKAHTPTETAAADEFTFEQFLADTAEPYKTYYQQLNTELFGLLAFTSKQEYQLWLQQGFPTTQDLDLIEEYSIEQLAPILFSRLNESDFTGHSSTSLAASKFRALGVLKALRHFETVIGYYEPDFNLLSNGEIPARFIDTDIPQQVNEALFAVNLSQAVVRDNSAFESLTRLKYEIMLASWNEGKDHVLSPLAIDALVNVSVQLGNAQVQSWLGQHYPDQLAAFQTAREKYQ